MNCEVVVSTDHNTLNRVEKTAWREKEGWCSPQEAKHILTVDKGPRFELVESETETIP